MINDNKKKMNKDVIDQAIKKYMTNLIAKSKRNLN